MNVPHDNLAKRYTTNLTEMLLCHLDRIALNTVTLAGGDHCQYGVEPFTWGLHTIPCARVHLDLEDSRKALRYCQSWIATAKDHYLNSRRIRTGLQEISPSFTLITVGYPNVGQSIQVWGNIVNPAELDVGRCDY